ncbi:MAG: sigma-54 dependent transcriptional regulator [Fulvivirga sp.]|nr:sigma-54 dependent transcriptional regulator [Fulvivirga sp.]
MPKTKAKILIVDDDDMVLLSAQLLLEQQYTEVIKINNPMQIEEAFKERSYDIVLLDMNFKQGETSGEEGLYWLKQIKTMSPDTNVVLMTAYGELDVAVEAMKEGATDFIVKPWQNEKLLATIQTAYKLGQQEQKVKQLEGREKIISSDISSHFEMIGNSHEMNEIRKIIEKVAKTDAEVLILGENGTGKEVAARAIHQNSLRAEEVFISVDLGSIPENLFESELFGHKKGAFTDAKEERIGRFEAASGGTLFLDEIGNLSPNLQTKLLTALQNKKITKVGTNEPVEVDVRVICATNSDIKNLVQEDKFREDLLYRINTVEMEVPPLRDRIDDIPLLANHFLNKYASKYHKQGAKLSEEALGILKKYHWPGNIRELQHAIERSVIMLEGNEITASDFRFLKKDDSSYQAEFEDYNLEHIEAWAIHKAIKKHNGNVSHAAKELGLSRGALYRRMDKYNI